MFKHFTLVSLLFLFSCVENRSITGKSNEAGNQSEISIDAHKSTIALDFVNNYVENCNKMKDALSVADWVSTNKLVTKRFKEYLAKIIDEANQLDPEMGLDADPIFDAQDYPDEGFELESLDNKNNIVHLKGKNMPDFKLKVRIVQENNDWLVDGCGMINMR